MSYQLYPTQLPTHHSSDFFFFNVTATTEIYTLSLHDALPISPTPARRSPPCAAPWPTPASTPPRSITSTPTPPARRARSEEHTSELQSQSNLVCRLLLEKKKKTRKDI